MRRPATALWFWRVSPMVTRGARIMAVAAFASTRCSSFLHGGSRLVRSVSRAGTHVAGPYATPQIEQVAKAHDKDSGGRVHNDNGRVDADDISLDTSLISKSPELVLGHLQARRMGQESTDAVHRIGGRSVN